MTDDTECTNLNDLKVDKAECTRLVSASEEYFL